MKDKWLHEFEIIDNREVEETEVSMDSSGATF